MDESGYGTGVLGGGGKIPDLQKNYYGFSQLHPIKKIRKPRIGLHKPRIKRNVHLGSYSLHGSHIRNLSWRQIEKADGVNNKSNAPLEAAVGGAIGGLVTAHAGIRRAYNDGKMASKTRSKVFQDKATAYAHADTADRIDHIDYLKDSADSAIRAGKLKHAIRHLDENDKIPRSERGDNIRDDARFYGRTAIKTARKAIAQSRSRDIKTVLAGTAIGAGLGYANAKYKDAFEQPKNLNKAFTKMSRGELAKVLGDSGMGPPLASTNANTNMFGRFFGTMGNPNPQPVAHVNIGNHYASPARWPNGPLPAAPVASL